ncbi:MAG: PAS domain S-box protein [Elusimicrobia bacterium]|nr:PAS domain S-box protein [Elusimicrobiota bacterium]
MPEFLKPLWDALFRPTGRQRQDARAQAQATLYRTLVERAPMSVLLIDPETTTPIEFNDMACRQLGYTREEFARLRITDYEAAETPEETRAHVQKVLREGGDEFRTRHRVKGGEIRDVLVTAWTVELSGRTLFHCVYRDITETVKAEKSAREAASIIEATPEGILITDEHGIIKYVNSGWERMSGWSSREVVGKVTPRVLKSDRNDPAIYARLWRTVTQGRSFRGEFYNRRRDGTHYAVESLIMPLKNAAGETTGFSGIERDITDRLRAEESLRQNQEQLRQAQKMEAVGRLAGGVAHDFNNLLTAIGGYADFLLSSIEPGDPRREDVGEIKKAGERASALTRQLLAFSRKQLVQLRILDFNAVVADIQKMLRRLLREDIALTVILSPEEARLRADQGQLEQVILNLVVNAGDAMPEGGKLTLEISRARMDEIYIHRHGAIMPGSYVTLTVNDTGCGMNEETQSHLFEPFFTTKERGKGTGLGLSTVYGIVTQIGGQIAVYSEEGRGTAFKVYLPLTEDALDAPPPAPSPQGPPLEAGTVLLVEDETAIRNLAGRILAQAGFTVIEAVNGREALDICLNHAGPIQLMLTDMVMPEMDGPELAERLATLRPEIRVVFMSGYTEHARIENDARRPAAAFIQKPFSPSELVQTIREALASRGEAVEARER